MTNINMRSVNALIALIALSLLSNVQSQVVPVSSSTVYTVTSSPAPSLVSFTPATPALALSDDAVDLGIPIGFNFVFYNVSYTNVNLAPNGNIQFQSSSSVYVPGLFGAGDAALAPFIAFFWTDLWPTTAGQRTYATIGTSPSRQFILRYANVGYCCSNVVGQGLSADVLLYEGTNRIEFRYYNFYIDNSHYVDIGIENVMSSAGTYDVISIINNVILNTTHVAALNNTSFMFTPITPFTNPAPYSIVTPVTTHSTMYNGVVQTAPSLVSFTPTGTLPLVDNTVVPVVLGFDFTFYNWTYNSIYISDNGNIQFVSAGTTAYPYEWGASNADLIPFIAFFFTDLTSTTGSRTYATVGTQPNRYFILRLTNIPYQTYIGDATATLSMDVLLYETSGNIEFRYYGVGAMNSAYYYTNIGIQNVAAVDNTYDYVSILNYQNIGSYAATQLVGKSIVISPRVPFTNPQRYTGPTAPVPVNTASTIYSGAGPITAPAPATFTASGFLPMVDNSVTRVFLGFNFTFYGTMYSSVYVSSKGNIQFQSSSNNDYPNFWGSGNSGLTPFIAFFFTSLLPTSGSRSWATLGDAPNRCWILRISDTPLTNYAGTGNLTMDVLLYQNNSNIEFRYYQVPSLNQYYYVNIGIQNVVANNTYDYVSILNQINLNAILSQPLAGKSYVISPLTPFINPPPFAFSIQPQSSSAIYSATLTQGVPPLATFTPSNNPPLPQTDNDVTQIPIGFNFVFYGISYTNVFISANGAIQFQTANAGSYPNTFGSGNAQLAPLIAFFYADLLPSTASSVRTYGVIGTSPNRQFILRYSNVALQSYIATDTLSCDVLLYETSNRIEIRYYVIPVFISPYSYVDIGIENAANATGLYDWIAIVNSKTVSPIIAISLNQTTYTFTPIVPFVNAPAFAPLTPNATTSTISTYSVTSRTTVPALISFTPASPALPLDDNSATRVSIGFNFTFYGYQYDKLYISSNGNLQLRSASTSGYPGSFTSTGSSSLWPYIAFYFADLYPNNVTSRTYGTIGTAPNRQFIVRFNAVPFSYASTMPAVTGDVILYETSNNIELRYYAVSPTPYTYDYVSIGIASAIGDYVSIVDYVSLNGAQALGLAGTSYVIAPTVPFVNPPFWGTQPLTVFSNSVYYNGSVSANVGDRLSFTPTILPVGDDAVTSVSIGFNFVFFNVSYNTVQLSTNGNIQFNPIASTSYSPGLFGSGVASLTPFIAAFFTDLWPGVANMTSYGRFGAVGSRIFVYRFSDVWYCCSQQVGQGLDADIVLFETTNVIEIRYYNVPIDSSHLVDIGIENSISPSGGYDYLYVFNDEVLNAFTAEKLNGSTIRFTPIVANSTTPVVNPANAPQPVSFSTIYNATVSVAPAKVALPSFTNITVTQDDQVTSGIPLGFTFNFYNVTYTQINVGSNGNAQFQSSATSYIPDLFGAGDAALSPFIAFFYSDLYPMNAGAVVYSTIGTPPQRKFILRWSFVSFCCSSVDGQGLSVDVILSEGTNTIEMRYYSVLTSGTRNVAIGIENVVSDGVYDYIAINNDVPISVTAAAAMQGVSYTFTPIRPFTGGNLTYPITPIYNVTTYQVTMSPAPTAINMGSNAVSMIATDDAVTSVALGFNFVFWNISYSTVGIGANGNLQFNQVTSTSWTPGLFGSGSSALTPFIAFFYADLYPNYAGQRSYVTLGTAGSKQFILRYSDVWFCCEQIVGQGLTVDVILSETTNTIEMRYYNVPFDGSHLVDIGIESSTPGYAEWIAIWNDKAFTAGYASTLKGQSVRFAPTYNYNPPVLASSSSSVPVVVSSSVVSSTGVSSSTSPSSSPVVVPSSSSVARSSSSAILSSSTAPSSTAPSSAVPSSSGTASIASSSLPTTVSSSSSAAIGVTSVSSSGGTIAPVDDTSSSSSGLSGGAIAGIVIGVIVGVILLCLLIFCIMFRRTGDKFSEHTDAAESEASHVHGADDGEAHDIGEVEMETV